ncbi:putative thioesterase [Cytobacillus firmus]|uniref:Putative thioesterase n=2 Tax=Cytobacillus TaxID=2675230 RepID=A0A366K381_CYTFI|nr:MULTISPECIES: thioesterase [Cytobacillus]RBP96216.1 putative thioesterase [Cytobacillus firmus]TDX46059.1 putative thioesterase [Cytobacillus oceanisediminis]
MKPGLQIGNQAVVHAVVSPEMFAQFEGEVIHPAYSTVTMIYHMEWASRLLIIPYLDEEEEGMGGAVSARHLSPSPEGSSIIITATVSKLDGNSVYSTITVHNGKILAGEGEVKQVILKKSRIAEMLKRD